MKYAIIKNNVVVNIAISDYPIEENWIASETAEIGDRYENGEFIKPNPIFNPLEYQWKRASEYPRITEYLDGIVKGDQNQIQKYIDDCLAVKAKYPKPE